MPLVALPTPAPSLQPAAARLGCSCRGHAPAQPPLPAVRGACRPALHWESVSTLGLLALPCLPAVACAHAQRRGARCRCSRRRGSWARPIPPRPKRPGAVHRARFTPREDALRVPRPHAILRAACGLRLEQSWGAEVARAGCRTGPPGMEYLAQCSAGARAKHTHKARNHTQHKHKSGFRAQVPRPPPLLCQTRQARAALAVDRGFFSKTKPRSENAAAFPQRRGSSKLRIRGDWLNPRRAARNG